MFDIIKPLAILESLLLPTIPLSTRLAYPPSLNKESISASSLITKLRSAQTPVAHRFLPLYTNKEIRENFDYLIPQLAQNLRIDREQIADNLFVDTNPTVDDLLVIKVPIAKESTRETIIFFSAKAVLRNPEGASKIFNALKGIARELSPIALCYNTFSNADEPSRVSAIFHPHSKERILGKVIFSLDPELKRLVDIKIEYADQVLPPILGIAGRSIADAKPFIEAMLSAPLEYEQLSIKGLSYAVDAWKRADGTYLLFSYDNHCFIYNPAASHPDMRFILGPGWKTGSHINRVNLFDGSISIKVPEKTGKKSIFILKKLKKSF